MAGVTWGWRVQALDRAIQDTRNNLKKLHVGERVPPNREVMDYFTQRADALTHQYDAALKRLTVGSADQLLAGQADPQLYFQERLHEVRGALERTAKARNMEAPLFLGLPKELPPVDAVPRFVVQVGLMQDIGERLMAVPGVAQVVSLKADDPQEVEPLQKGDESFLMRLPVRVRVQCSLEALGTLLSVWSHSTPVVELQEVHVNHPPATPTLDVECVVARYVVTKPVLESATGQDEERPRPPRARKS